MSFYRLWFILLYALGFAVFLMELIRFRRRDPDLTRQVGLMPPPPALLNWLVVLAILVTRIGKTGWEWPVVRWIGVALSLYGLVVAPWAARTMGGNFVPGAGIIQDHGLVTNGPFRWVRHPTYSAVLALWLGASLGTLDWLLLVLWPLVVVVILRQARIEEDLMRAEFGVEYEAYAERTGAIVPGLG